MKHLSILITIICLFIFGNINAQSVSPSNTKSSTISKLVNKKHKLSLQWISWEKMGTISFYYEGKNLVCNGEQLSPDNNTDYLRINGVVTVIDDKTLKIEGTIATRVSHINNGEECLREGTFVFKSTQNRKYWRLQEKINPCDKCTDYVDIYF